MKKVRDAMGRPGDRAGSAPWSSPGPAAAASYPRPMRFAISIPQFVADGAFDPAGFRHPAALRRGVRHGDGFFGAGSSTTAQFAEQVRVVRDALRTGGRDPAGFGIAKRVYLAVDDDAQRAQQRVAASLVELYGEFGRGLEPVTVWGPPEACVRGLQEVADAGAELILLNPLSDEAEQMERLAAEVVPHLRGGRPSRGADAR